MTNSLMYLHAFVSVFTAAAAAAAGGPAAGVHEVFVDPHDGDDALGGTFGAPLRTVHAAAVAVRAILERAPGSDVTVQLLSGVHHVGGHPLRLGPSDGGSLGGWVTWRSHDPVRPAVIGAPISVTGWKPHSTIDGVWSAPLPSNITKGSPLRQLWVNGIRAQRTRVYGRQQGDNKEGFCHNLTSSTPTALYPAGSAFDFTYESATDPSSWENPGDVEFIYTGCDAINCWIEPRCTVESVSGKVVTLKQGYNSSCFHRLYYYPQCFSNGTGPALSRGRNPTSIENVGLNASDNTPGTFYYDRSGGIISYVPRAGETVGTLEAGAITAVQQELLVINRTQNIQWEGVHFEYGTWLGASGPKGYIDTQSGYLCQDGEPPTNVAIAASTNVTFASCTFQHLGAVYAVGADAGSQSVVVSNSTFTDCSGGGIKLGRSGERGADPPSITLDPALQDRGYLISDNLLTGIPTEFSSANPIFAAYVADTHLVHNTIHDSEYSAICVGWGWGLDSYMRNVRIENNSITQPLQVLADGGGVYTNTPCPNCHVSGNYFEGDPHVFGCLYHDGGSGLWTDENNVFNHIRTSAVFCHGTCPGISISPIYYNDSGAPSLEGATNFKLHDRNGVCQAPVIVKLGPGQPWPDVAAEVVRAAGRRPLPLPPLVVPPLSPPNNLTQNQLDCQACIRFQARPCDAFKPSQKFFLLPGVEPGDGRWTTVKSGVKHNASCWQVDTHLQRITCDKTLNAEECASRTMGPDGCKSLPTVPYDPHNRSMECEYDQAFVFNANGTIALANTRGFADGKTIYFHKCLQINKDTSVSAEDCRPADATGHENQIWDVALAPDGSITIKQGELCVDNNYAVYQGPPDPREDVVVVI